MLYMYDVALKNHIKRVYENVYLAERTKLFKKIRKETVDSETSNIELPAIGLWRIENQIESDRVNYGEFKRGKEVSKDTDTVTLLKGINIPLMYQIDIIAGSYVDCDDLLTDLIMFLREEPVINFNLGEIPMKFGVDLTDLSISTDYGSHSDTGKIYSHTLTVNIPEARILYTGNSKRYKKLMVDIKGVASGDLEDESLTQGV